MKKIVILFCFLFISTAFSQSLDFLLEPKDYISKRISSFDQSGGNGDRLTISADTTVTIAHITSPGIIKHIWVTISAEDQEIRRNAIIRMYWDGEPNPSVESPIGDFFGQGWNESYQMNSLPIVAAPVQGNAMICYFPMPFSSEAVITIENQSDKPIDAFYYYVDYEEHASVSPSIPRFHAWWNRTLTPPVDETEHEWGIFGEVPDHPKELDGNYIWADIKGKGYFVGVNYYVDCPTPVWYGEGDDMFFIDGEVWPPSMHGTGTEDFFNTSWCPKEKFMHPYFGYPRVNETMGWLGRTHVYRFLLEAPITFKESCIASIEHGHANDLTLDLCSVAYWYQSDPHKVFPEILPKEKRQPMPKIGVTDIHRWRDAWRKMMGGGTLWGNEEKK